MREKVKKANSKARITAISEKKSNNELYRWLIQVRIRRDLRWVTDYPNPTEECLKKGVEIEYRILGKKGEGTFSEVLKCQHVKDGTYYACKKMKQHYDGFPDLDEFSFTNDGFMKNGKKRKRPDSTESNVDQVNNLREIQAMRRLNPHANIIGLHEIIYDKKTGTVALICELMDMNIYELIRGRRHYVPEQKVKSYMFQLLKSLDHMHRCGIFHRDVKPENILVKDDVLKLADFGSCRSVYSKPPYTEYISTRWYRAPECLLTDGYYSYRMDLWSVGCVFFEVMSLHPLFPGANEVDQISKIHDILGTPDASILNKMKHRNRGINFDFPTKKGTGIEKLIPHASQQSIELIYKMCTYDPDERITAKQALRHPYFKELRDAEKRALEAQQTRTNETNSVKNATNSTTGGDIPAWRQNQIQKKREDSRTIKRKESYASNRVCLSGESKRSKRKLVHFASRSERWSCTNLTGAKDGNAVEVRLLSAKKGILKKMTAAAKKQKSSSSKTSLKQQSQSDKTEKKQQSQSDKKENGTVKAFFKTKYRGILDAHDAKRRQRRLVEQQGGATGGVIGSEIGKSNKGLPQILPVNGSSIHAGSTFGAGGGAKSHYSSSNLPKVHLPHHHRHQTNAANLLPGILKTNMLQPKTFPKTKIKVIKKPNDSVTKSIYSHYQLPAINRHVYHH